MKIGIIVFSSTGHTLSVAQKLEEELSSKGHAVTLIQLEVDFPLKKNTRKAELKSKPTVDLFNAHVFASPVNGGRMAEPMESYLKQIVSLKGKKVACLVTHFFPHQWGGDQTLQSMKEVCTLKGAQIVGTGSVRWFSLNRKSQINDVVNNLSKLFLTDTRVCPCGSTLR